MASVYTVRMHPRSAFGIALVVLALVVALFQFLANYFYLYWLWWWADVVMHFLGGLLVSGFVLWWIRFEVPVHLRKRLPVFLTAFAVIVGVGVSWEIFEYVTNSYASANYTLDTTFDLAMNIVGMLFAYLIFRRL